MWWVVGGSGFVGRGVLAELERRGIPAQALRAPRLTSQARTGSAAAAEAASLLTMDESLRSLVGRLGPGDVVVNCAGLATPDTGEGDVLFGANSVLPAALALVCRDAAVSRFVHVSSAAVQGERAVLDESWSHEAFSPYSQSKAAGEDALRELLPSLPPRMTTILRATSVQGPGRRTTAALAAVASSPLASVAGSGSAPSPVSSLNSLAEFTVDVAESTPDQPIILQPWEGLSVRDVLAAASGREPARLPEGVCKLAVRTARSISRRLGGRLDGPIRRVEVMWFGQGQRAGWAEATGTVPTRQIARVLSSARKT